MKCYENPRQTNEETDACAEKHRLIMQKLNDSLTAKLMRRCVSEAVSSDGGARSGWRSALRSAKMRRIWTVSTHAGGST